MEWAGALGGGVCLGAAAWICWGFVFFCRGRRHSLCVDLPRQKLGAVGRWVVMAADAEVVKLRWA